MQMCVVVILLFVLMPFMSFYFVIAEVYNKRKYSYYLLFVLMGLFSMYYFPYQDQYRYMEGYLFLQDKNFSDIFIYDNIVLYFLNLFDIFMFVFSKTGISYEIFRFIIVVLSYMLVFVTVKKTLKKMNCNSDICFLSFLVIFFSVPYFIICSGFRTGFGACILSVGVYCLYSLKKRIGLLLVLVSCLIHYMYFIYFGLILFSFCVGRLTKVKIVFFLIISLFLQCLLLKISGSLDFEYLSLIGNGDYSDYVQGEWGLNYGWNAKKFISIMAMSCFPLIVQVFFFRKMINDSGFSKLIFLNVLFYIIISPYRILLSRYSWSLILLINIYILYHIYEYCRMKKMMLLIILTTLIISFSASWRVNRFSMPFSRQEELLYKPLPLLLMNSYSLKEASIYLSVDGEFR